MEALRRLPSGRIRKSSDKTALAAVSWLIDQVPDDNPLKADIARLYEEALARSS